MFAPAAVPTTTSRRCCSRACDLTAGVEASSLPLLRRWTGECLRFSAGTRRRRSSTNPSDGSTLLHLRSSEPLLRRNLRPNAGAAPSPPPGFVD